MALEREPTIVIACTKVPMPGDPGQWVLQPRVSMANMPAENALQGWSLTHKLLLQCVEIAAQQMLQAIQGEPRVALVPMLPGDLMKH